MRPGRNGAGARARVWAAEGASDREVRSAEAAQRGMLYEVPLTPGLGDYRSPNEAGRYPRCSAAAETPRRAAGGAESEAGSQVRLSGILDN